MEVQPWKPNFVRNLRSSITDTLINALRYSVCKCVHVMRKPGGTADNLPSAPRVPGSSARFLQHKTKTVYVRGLVRGLRSLQKRHFLQTAITGTVAVLLTHELVVELHAFAHMSAVYWDMLTPRSDTWTPCADAA